MKRARTVAAVCLAIAALALPVGAWAQTSRTVKIIVPTPPGGGSDILARQLAEQIGHVHGVTFVIENRPGGGNVIGFEAASRAEPDGNTLLLITNAFVIIPHLRKLSYDTLTGFAPVCKLASSPSTIAVNSASAYRTLKDFLDAARAKPNALTLASIGPATPYHLGLQTLQKAAGVSITYVPFAGATPVVNALLGQHVTAMIGSYSNVAGQVEAGRFRVLAVAAERRLPPLPDVPTVAETYKGFNIPVWFGVAAPAKTPPAALAETIGWFTEAMRAPEIVAKLDLQGLYPAVTCGDEFGVLLRQEYEDVGRVIRGSNLKAD